MSNKNKIKLLFLEGSIECGKSTLLRETLTPCQSVVGGFVSQRLMNTARKKIGFRIAAGSDFRLNVLAEQNQTNVFKITRPDGLTEKHPEVFETIGVNLLKNNDGKKIILLDEIGGSELLCPQFKTVLYTVLTESLPCIGVLKQAKSAEHMIRAAGYHQKIVEENKKLRAWLSDRSDCKILTLTIDNREQIKRELEHFLCGLSITN